MDGTSETTLVNGSKLYSTDEMNIPKLLTLKIHFYLIYVYRYWTQTDCDVILPVEDYPYNNSEYKSCREKFSSGDISYNLWWTHVTQ